MKELFLIRKFFIFVLIFFALFSNNIDYGAESINDFIMEEITDNTAHPF